MNTKEIEAFTFADSLLEAASVEEGTELSQYTFRGEWDTVVKLYETKAVQRSVITSSKDTALHMAINDEREDVVKRMVEIIMQKEDGEALLMKNDKGETPLHRAATRKSVTMCEHIVEAGQAMGLDLLSVTNKSGETPIYTAALYNRKPAFIFLHRAAKQAFPHDAEKPYQFLRRTAGSGKTVLHSVIRREHFDLAWHLIKMYPDLMGRSNAKGITPLHVLAKKPSAFRSGLHLPWWKQIIYYCVQVDPLEYDSECTFTSTTSDKTQEDIDKCPDNYLTCYQFLWGCRSVLGKIKGYMRGPVKSSDSQDETIVNQIRREKEKHVWSVQILTALMEKNNIAYITEGTNPGVQNVFDPRQQNPPTTGGSTGDTDKKTPKEDPEKTYTPLLLAAQQGVIEVINEILTQLPVTIYETTSKGKNILQVAVENRQPSVIEAVRKQVNKELKLNLWDDLAEAVDTNENTILHLAAMYDASKAHPWQSHGTAMQMQWEIKWYEYVKSLSPHHFLSLNNKQDETPGQIFNRDHQKLVKDSAEWLKDTSESCSVVAALVAGVSFATSSQVPGGTNGDTGRPTLAQQPAFELFAITALIGLCFSVTALIMFLSILTSRKLPRDFKRNLPMKILLGLSSLFVSIASMLISFCAAHFFVLEDRFKTAVFPLYAATCLPVSFYAIVQFPLYMDLLKSIVIQVPQSLPPGHV